MNYRYKLVTKQDEKIANQAFNNELFEQFNAKDSIAFWHMHGVKDIVHPV